MTEIILGREAILGAPDLPTERVAVPEWGGTVCVRGLSGTERDELELSQLQMQNGKAEYRPRNFRAELAARVLVSEAGERLFTPADVEALGAKSAVALQRVFDVALRLSGFSAADLKDLEKN